MLISKSFSDKTSAFVIQYPLHARGFQFDSRAADYENFSVQSATHWRRWGGSGATRKSEMGGPKRGSERFRGQPTSPFPQVSGDGQIPITTRGPMMDKFPSPHCGPVMGKLGAIWSIVWSRKHRFELFDSSYETRPCNFDWVWWKGGLGWNVNRKAHVTHGRPEGNSQLGRLPTRTKRATCGTRLGPVPASMPTGKQVASWNTNRKAHVIHGRPEGNSQLAPQTGGQNTAFP